MPGIDDHMDELFQKAAGKYPLKTSGANWNKVSGKLHHDRAKAAKPAALKKYMLLVAALFIVIVSVGLLWYYQPEPVNSHEKLSRQLKKETADKKARQTAAEIKSGRKNKGGTDTKKTPGQGQRSPGSYQADSKESVSSSKKSGIVLHAANLTYQEKKSGENTINLLKAAHSNISHMDSFYTNVIKVSAIASDQKPDQLSKNQSVKKPAVDQTSAKEKPAIYYGFTVGSQLSQVNRQGVTKPGISAGVVLGLSIKKQIALETGLHFSQKKYFSSGEYFNPKRGTMPDEMNVLSLDGTSSYLEIPLDIKYNLSGKPNTLYITSGLSSYIMIKERNLYKVEIKREQTQINSSYGTVDFYTAADLNIGIGYQRSIGKSRIRLEPYMQIPLKGTGIGSLKVLNTGFQVIISRNEQREK